MKKLNENIAWIKEQNKVIELATIDMMVYGIGIIKINSDCSIEHVDYITWLNMSEDEKRECNQLSV